MADLQKEEARLRELFTMESQLHQQGYALVAGVDEAGRGPLAGPVVAGAVILAVNSPILDLKDSKLLSEKKREAIYDQITTKAIAWSYDIVDKDYIDEHNILRATERAMTGAVKKLHIQPNFVLVDAVKLPNLGLPQRTVIRGDQLCASIAAASIVAKVARDRIMIDYDSIFPEYGFKKHKGYGTKEHVDSIKKYGFSPIHRQSFSVKGLEV